jgi:hypothetical protein
MTKRRRLAATELAGRYPGEAGTGFHHRIHNLPELRELSATMVEKTAEDAGLLQLYAPAGRTQAVTVATPRQRIGSRDQFRGDSF